jgi:predicted amidohydrolase YtcJ
VWLERVDGHAGWANSIALSTAGVTAATADPAGGKIERIAGGRQPAGVLVDAAMQLVAAKVPPPRASDRDLALHEAQELLVRHGVTAVADMGTTIEDWMTFRRAGDAGRLRIRIMAYAASVPEMLLIGGDGPTPWLYQDRLRMGGLKLYLDGALGSRGARLKAPYADDPGNTGLWQTDGTALRNNMSRAAMDGYQVAVHAIGDAANAEVLERDRGAFGPTTAATGAGASSTRRSSIPADIPRFGQHGVIASMQPVHQTSDRLMAEARLGPDRLAGPTPGARSTPPARRWRSARTRRSRRPTRSPGSPSRSAARTRRASRSAAGTRSRRLRASRRLPPTPRAPPMPASPRASSAGWSRASAPISWCSTPTR